MPAQGAVRDRCTIVVTARGNWCVAHDLPAAHAQPQEGDVHADPADRPLASDLATPDAEEQYAGTIRGAGRLATTRDARVRAAVAALRDPEASPGQVHEATETLARLRAESWAAAQTWSPRRPELLPMGGACADCGRLVMRTAELVDEFLTVAPWRHVGDGAAIDHPVTRVVFAVTP